MDTDKNIDILVSKRDNLAPEDSKRDLLKREIFALLKEKYHTGTKKTFYHQRFNNTLSIISWAIKSNLREKEILQPLKYLRNDKRKEEITDTSLVSYLELLFGNDTLEYMVWKRDNETISSTSDYLTQQNLIIQSLDFNIWYLTDHEVKLFFSTCTDHQRTGDIPMIRYRHQAIASIPKLKEVFATAIPYKLNANELSYKVITLTQWPWTGKIIEFVYNSPLDENGYENRQVYVRVHLSILEYKKVLQSSLESISQKIISLQHIKDIFGNRYQKNKDNKNKNDRAIEFEKFKNRLSGYYQGMYTDRIQVRIDRSEEHKKYMQAPQYAMSMWAMLRDLDLAIQDQTAKFHRLQQYAKGKE